MSNKKSFVPSCCRPLRFIQTWIVPERRGLTPNYGSYNAAKDGDRKNQVLHLASNVKDTSNNNTPVKLNQDVNCHAAELELGKSGKTS